MKINVTSTSYGENCHEQEDYTVNTTCNNDVTKNLATKCNDKYSCYWDIPTPCDPSPLCPLNKYMEIKYKCGYNTQYKLYIQNPKGNSIGLTCKSKFFLFYFLFYFKKSN